MRSAYNCLSAARGVELAASDRRGPFTAALSYTYLRAIEEPSGLQLVRRPKHSGEFFADTSIACQAGPQAPRPGGRLTVPHSVVTLNHHLADAGVVPAAHLSSPSSQGSRS